ncbi:MAG TPA: amidohydrolase family protein [Chloroflexota bacterium]
MAFDLVIKDARVVDGSGMPWYMADVAVTDGRIAAIGRIPDAANRTIEADGLALAPGFIDQHTHLDAHLLWDPAALPLPEHGVTTVVTGNCGLSLMPALPGHESALIGNFVRVEAIPRQILESVDWRWRSTADYLDVLDQRLGVNVACLIGHNAIRECVLGEDATEREATAEEIEDMCHLMRQAMRDGALGFSMNRNPRHFREDRKPLPSRVSTPDELLRVAGVLSEFNAGMVQHSAPGARNPEYFDWIAQLGQASGRPVIYSSINYDAKHPDDWREHLAYVERFAEHGLRLFGNTNIVPFVNYFTLRNVQFFDELPSGIQAMGLPLEERRQAIADPGFRSQLRAEMSPAFAGRLGQLKIIETRLPEHRHLEGKSVNEAARLLRASDALDALFDLSLAEDLETSFMSGTPIEDAMGEIVASQLTVVGQSDAGAHVQFLSNFGVCTTLLGQYVRERQLLTLENAVHQLTFKIARILDIRDRGLIWPGWRADLVLFDPDTVDSRKVEDAADYPGGLTRKLQHAKGVEYTIVNGEVLIEHGHHTGAYPGRVIRNSSVAEGSAA